MQLSPVQLAPARCFLCSNTPDDESDLWVDTQREYDPGFVDERNGRIYICRQCGAQVADALGFVEGSKLVHAMQEARIAQHQLEEYSALDHAAIDRIISAVKERIVTDAPKPPVTRRPRAAKE